MSIVVISIVIISIISIVIISVVIISITLDEVSSLVKYYCFIIISYLRQILEISKNVISESAENKSSRAIGNL